MRLLRNFPRLKNVGKYEMLFKIELLLLWERLSGKYIKSMQLFYTMHNL